MVEIQTLLKIKNTNMKTYLISYDLRVPETSEDYKKLIDHIKSYNSWATPLKSVWFITTSSSVSQVRDDIKSRTDVNDGLLVMDVTGSNWGTIGVGIEVTDWMKENI
jgi:hypothetical protein